MLGRSPPALPLSRQHQARTESLDKEKAGDQPRRDGARDHRSTWPPLRKGGTMPRQRSLVTVIRDMVRQEVGSAIQSLLGSVSRNKPKKAKNGRRRRRKGRGKWRPGGPGRPPKAVAAKMAHAKRAKAAPVAATAKTTRRRRKPVSPDLATRRRVGRVLRDDCVDGGAQADDVRHRPEPRLAGRLRA